MMKNIKLNIDEDFFSEEIRDGYTITTEMKKIWAVELDLLNEFFRICEKYKIKAFAYAGTLLGAIRHNGFIPWDEDVDVCMTREEYNKLLSVAEREFVYPYFFQTSYNDRKFFNGYARLRNSETTGIIAWNKSVDYNNGIYIDIHVLDGYIEDKKRLKKQIIEKDLVSKLLYAYYSDLSERNGWKKIAVVILQKTIFKIIKYDSLLKKFDKISYRYNKYTDRLTLMTCSKYFLFRYWCKKEDIENQRYVKFEFLKIPIPINGEKILRNIYGDYLTLPPMEERGKWHENKILFNPDISYKVFLRKENE